MARLEAFDREIVLATKGLAPEAISKMLATCHDSFSKKIGVAVHCARRSCSIVSKAITLAIRAC